MTKKNLFLSLIMVSFLLSSCASYNARPLNNLSVYTQLRKERLSVVAKAFDKEDCKKYLDRDVIQKGYQPVQLQIQNNTDSSYLFSLSRIELPCARSDEVAEKVHTSTVGRAASYGIAAVLTTGLFAIPAVIDGFKSAEANDHLDHDFFAKSAKDQLIQPFTNLNTLIFVPVEDYRSRFNITLLEEGTNRLKTFNVEVK